LDDSIIDIYLNEVTPTEIKVAEIQDMIDITVSANLSLNLKYTFLKYSDYTSRKYIVRNSGKDDFDTSKLKNIYEFKIYKDKISADEKSLLLMVFFEERSDRYWISDQMEFSKDAEDFKVIKKIFQNKLIERLRII
jgi:hypothetical protein